MTGTPSNPPGISPTLYAGTRYAALARDYLDKLPPALKKLDAEKEAKADAGKVKTLPPVSPAAVASKIVDRKARYRKLFWTVLVIVILLHVAAGLFAGALGGGALFP